MNHAINLFIAYFVDRLIGDPRFLVHPVVIIGKGITLLEKLIRKWFPMEKYLQIAGLLFPIVIVGGTFCLVTLVLYGASLVNHWLAMALDIWLISTTVATKGLGDAGMEVYRFLKNKDLDNARNSLAMIVGRDTHQLDESEISRGTVETVAENIVDAIISPLFYALIGGAPLAMAYRAVNTLDSMVGYKNERYQNLGWASARFDDLANYLPARLTACFLLAACWLEKLAVRNAWRMIKRDARLHPSPNSGITEAGVAGALGVQLGGTNFYQGIASNRAKMGEPTRQLEADDIIQTVKIMKLTSLICTLLFIILSVLFHFYMR